MPDWLRLAVSSDDSLPPLTTIVTRMAIALLCGLSVSALYRITLGRGRKNLQTLRRADIDGAAASYLDAWARLLDGDLRPLMTALTGLDHTARDLRNLTPFAGVVKDEDRRALIKAIR